jgi:hypothetical protein
VIAMMILSSVQVPDICGVLESAYTVAIESKTPASPIDVQPSWRSLELEEFVPDYPVRATIPKREFDDLISRQARHRDEKFRPLCVWRAKPVEARDYDGHRMTVSFTSPIFSTDEKLALVEVSFRESGFGYGKICIVRGGRSKWSAECHDSWIT